MRVYSARPKAPPFRAQSVVAGEYGLALRLVLFQIKQALELKPFSKAYQEVYARYAPLLTQS